MDAKTKERGKSINQAEICIDLYEGPLSFHHVNQKKLWRGECKSLRT